MSQTPEEIEEELDELYLSDPPSNSIGAFIEGLTILSKYVKDGLRETYFSQAEHDCLHLHFSLEKCPLNSEDGRRLLRLGFHADTENEQWGWNT